MKVCLITPELAPYRAGGIGAYVAALAAGIGGRGHLVDVVGCDISSEPGIVRHDWGRRISLSSGSHPMNGFAPQAIEDCLLWLSRHRTPAVWRARSLLQQRRLLASALMLRRFVRRHGDRYDIIEYTNWPGHAAFLPTRTRAAHLVRISTSSADIEPHGSWVPFALEKRVVSRAQVVIAHTEAMNRKGQLLYGYAPERGVVINLGMPDRPLPSPPPRDGRLIIVSLGRAEHRKGTDLLLNALARVLPEFPSLVYRSIGSGLPEYLRERPDLRPIWARLRAEHPGQVEDLGRVSDEEKERLVAGAHWLVAPSRFESFGLMAVEAMRAGTPVLYAAVGGLAEVGSKGPSNLAVRGDDVADLERGLREVCTRGVDHALAARPAARMTYDRFYREDAMIDRTLEAYRGMIGKGRGARNAARKPKASALERTFGLKREKLK